MYINKKLVLFLCFFIFIMCGSVSACEQTNDTLQSENNVYYVNYSYDGSYSDIASALNSAGDNKTIYINSGVYTGLNNTNLTLEGNIQLIGKNTVLDGQQLNKILTVTKNSNVHLVNLTFINGYDMYKGGAISNYGNLIIDNCIFTNNYVFNDFNLTPVYGGAIYNNGSLSINNSYFGANYLGSSFQISSFGGAIYTNGSLFVNNSCFQGNVLNTFIYTSFGGEYGYQVVMTKAFIPQRGGAIAGKSNNIKIIGSKFNNNVLSSFYDAHFVFGNFVRVSSGGAIDIMGDNLIVKDCIFENSSADVGGAVSFSGNNITFSNNSFINNNAYTGGAIYCFDNYVPNEYYMGIIKEIYHTVTISDCLFKDNYLNPRTASLDYCYSGCAVFLEVNDVTISNSRFISNTFDVDYNFDNTTIQFDKLYKYRNFCYGGAIYVSGNNSHIDNCSFNNNSGDVGGAIYSKGDYTLISNSYFDSNEAISRDGGAIYNADVANFIVVNSTFINNNASIAGGAISSSDSSHSNYTNCSFINNTASLGGAIYDTGDNAQFYNLNFTNNSASSGGAIYNNGFKDKISNCNFVGNFAFGQDYSNGGAIYNLGSNTRIYSSYFLNNTADYHGGAIYQSGANIQCNDCSFENSNSFAGGSIYLDGNAGSIDYSNFINNFAIYGGAIYNNALNIRITNGDFKRNRANVSGGAIYNSASVLSIYNNHVNNCSAKLYGDYIYTKANIAYLTVSVLNNASLDIIDHENKYLFVNITDNLGNPITGGNVSFLIYDAENNDYIDVGTASVYEGIAFIEYVGKLSWGSHKLSANYTYASDPIFNKAGTLLSLISSELHITVNSDLELIKIKDTFNLNIILIDGNGDYIANGEIQIYENYKYIGSIFTDDAGFYNYTSNNVYKFGTHIFTFIFVGDLIHDSASVEFNFTLSYDGLDMHYDELSIFSYYPLVFTSQGSEIPFEFQLKDDDGNCVGNFAIGEYLYVLRNGQFCDNDLFSYGEGHVKSKILSETGTFFVHIVENDPGVYVYTICFNGGSIFVGDEYKTFAPTNTSIILIVKDDNADVKTKFVISYDSFNEAEFPSFNLTLKDSNNTSLEAMNVSVYDSGNFLTSFITNSSVVSHTLPCYLDKGEHLIEFVFGGYGNYIASYDAFNLEISENPNKEEVFFNLTSPRVVSGYGNNFTITLLDNQGNLLNDFLVDVEILYNNVSLKNSTLNINDLNIPLNYGAGNYSFNCLFNGNRFYLNSSAVFEVHVSKFQTQLWGISSVEVLDNNTYLSYVLIDENNAAMANKKIRLDIYSTDLNTTYYGFTNDEGLCNWKVNLPVGKYFVLAYFEGEKWWESSSKVLTNVSVWGDTTRLIRISNIIKNKDYYTVKLTDSEGNPLEGKAIIITINGKSYKKITDNAGYASLKINLNYGVFEVTSAFKGDLNYRGSSIVSSLYVVNENWKFPTLLSLNNSLTFRINNQGFSIQLLDASKSPLVNKTITLLIDNKKYDKITDDGGVVSFNLNLDFGLHEFKAVFNGDSDYEASNCSGVLRIVDKNAASTTLTTPSYVIFKEKGNYFNVTLTDKKGNPLVNETVVIEVNGVAYNKVTDGNGRARLKINLNPGSYEIYCHFDGTFSYFFSESSTKLVIINPVNNLNLSKISGPNSLTIFGKGKYKINLTDGNNNPLANKSVTITVNGVSYVRVSDNEGVVSLNINLGQGQYSVSAIFNGDDYYRPSNSFLTVLKIKPTFTRMDNFVKYYKSSEQFTTGVLNSNGEMLVNASISMNINGVFYTRYTNENGTVRLNINLSPGEYILTAIDPIGSCNSYKITVLSTLIVHDLVKVYKNDSQYEIKLLDSHGEVLANHDVSININGVFYTRTTDENGIAILNINLNPGKYIATVEDLNNGLLVSSNILVLSATPVFSSINGVFIEKGQYYTVSLKCSDGVAISGEKVSIEINGRIYNRTTDIDGLASLRINLDKGTYLLKYHWYFNNQTVVTNIRVI